MSPVHLAVQHFAQRSKVFCASTSGQQFAAHKYQIIKEIDSVAVDRVQSEPLSGQFPLTGNKREKFSAFAPKLPQGNPLSHWIYDTYGSPVRFRPLRNRELLISYQGMIPP